MATKLFKQIFVTGCDRNTEWMLPWFLRNYAKHNKTPLIFADFGVSEEALNGVSMSCAGTINMRNSLDRGWFKKPGAMLEASRASEKVCWIDTDCEVLGDLSDVFNFVEPNKLSLAEDKPWSSRRGETWHNSGVVAFEGRPPILEQWAARVRANPAVGDQEVLHDIVREGLNRQIYISTLPPEFNWLRLMLTDGMDSKRKKVMHWTGQAGKQHIKEVLYG